MHKRLLIILSTLLLFACADKEQYQQAILSEMQTEQDIKDYNITPEKMSECIFDLSSKNMPGFFPFDPYRLTAYRNYAKLITVKQSKDPKKTLLELRQDFGSSKAVLKARSNYTESIEDCFAAILMESEK